MQHDLELQVAISLLFGSPLPEKRPNTYRLITLLQHNRIPLAVLPQSAALETLLRDHAFAQFWEGERKRYEQALAAYTQVYDAWKQEGIQAVLIKSPGYFPYTSDNVDVLVSHDQKEKATKILQNLGYIELPHVREPHKQLFRKMRRPYMGFPIHLHTGVAWINSFFTDVEIIDSCQDPQDGSAIVYPSAEHILMITTAHWLYEDKELKLRDLYHTHLALSNGIDWKYVWEMGVLRGWHSELKFGLLLCKLVEEQFNINAFNEQLPELSEDDLPRWLSLYFRRLAQRQLVLPLKLSKVFCKGLHFGKTIKDPSLATGRKLKELHSLIRFALKVKIHPLRRGKCFVVALSGPDGAGKTTMAHNLQGLLKNTFALRTRYHWLRLGSSKGLEIFKGLLRLWGRDTSSSGSSAGSTSYKHFLERHPRLRALWGYVLACDFLLQLWLRMPWAKLIGGIHIFDRYAVDAAVDLASTYKFKSAHWIIKLSPKANLGVFLWVDQNEALKRSTTPASSDRWEESLRLYELYQEYFHMRLSGREDPGCLLEQVAQPILREYLNQL
jgi:energy-coupling factor transporter ATP-binding protein EcfA2